MGFFVFTIVCDLQTETNRLHEGYLLSQLSFSIGDVAEMHRSTKPEAESSNVDVGRFHVFSPL